MLLGNTHHLVRQARLRILGNQILAQSAHAGSAALVAFILLLLFGSQALSWPVALAIPLAAAAVGLYRVKRRMPSPYGVAQLLDQRLGLADNLSTALYFSEVDPGAPVAPDIRRAQFEQAARIGLPGRMPDDPAEGMENSLNAVVFSQRSPLILEDFRNGAPVELIGEMENGFFSYLGIPIPSHAEDESRQDHCMWRAQLKTGKDRGYALIVVLLISFVLFTMLNFIFSANFQLHQQNRRMIKELQTRAGELRQPAPALNHK